MSRRYSVPINAVALASAKVDLWAITTTATMPCVVEEVILDPNSTSVSEFNISFHIFTGAFTAGSGGTTITPAKHVPGDAAASCTAKIMNTTQTTGGTNTVVRAGQWQLVNGWLWQPADVDQRYYLPPAASPFTCFVVSLDTTPGTQTVSGNLIFREDY